MKWMPAAGIVLLGLALGAGATDRTWLGNTDTDFENTANWVGGTAPGPANDVAVFDSAGTYQPSLTASRNIMGLNFKTAGWTLGGNFTLTLGSSGIASAGVGTNTINANIDLPPGAGDVAPAANNVLILNGVVGGGWIGYMNGSGTARLSGTTTNTLIRWDVSGGTLEFDKHDGGAIARLCGYVYSGTMRWLRDQQLPDVGGPNVVGDNSWVDLNGHNENLYWDIVLSGGGHIATGGGLLKSAYDFDLGSASASTRTLSGNVYMWYFDKHLNTTHGTAPNGIDLDISAALTTGGASSFYVQGSAVVRLSGDNSGMVGWPVYVQNTSKLIVANTNGSATGSGPVTVDSGATLGGGGTIVMAGGNTLTNNGTIGPGEGIGTLTVTGDVTFASGSQLSVEVSGANADNLTVTGNLTISGATTPKVLITELSVPKASHYIIVSYTGALTGAFDGSSLPAG